MLLTLLFWLALSSAADHQDPVPFAPVTVERLPDLTVPRSAHTVLYINGELTVVGGHTTGFRPTATAEYYRDGQWHLVESLYPHDYGFCVPLPSGNLLVAGGCAEPFGIGQSFGAESYDPVAHSFSPLPILDQRRALANAALLSDSTIVISGNWHSNDDISLYSLQTGGRTLKAAAQERNVPYILPTAPDNAVIFGTRIAVDKDRPFIVDRLQGEPFEVPLLKEWLPIEYESNSKTADYFIGDEGLGGYAWLFLVENEEGKAGVVKLVGESFSLLETDVPIPSRDADGRPVCWIALHVDREAGHAWLQSRPLQNGCICLCRIDYVQALRGGKAPLTLYRAQLWDKTETNVDLYSTLLPGGRIAIVGGNMGENYHPLAEAFILHTEPVREARLFSVWPLVAGVFLASLLAGLFIWRRKKPSLGAESTPETPPSPAPATDLLSRIYSLMEDERLFTQKGLTKADIAARLGTNETYVSSIVNGQTGKSFTDLVNDYRIRYAKELMKEHPERLLSDVALDAGFSGEAQFFRAFKARTGQTPGEWRESAGNPASPLH